MLQFIIFVTALNLLKKYIFYDKIDEKDSKKASQYSLSIIQVSKDFIIEKSFENAKRLYPKMK